MISPEVQIAIEAFRKAFERADALGVNVKAFAPTLPGPRPGDGYVIQMKDISFALRAKPTPVINQIVKV